MKPALSSRSHPSSGKASGKANSSDTNKGNGGADAKRVGFKSLESTAKARERPTASTMRNERTKRKTNDDHPDSNDHSKRGRTETEDASISSEDNVPVDTDCCDEVYDDASSWLVAGKRMMRTNKIDRAIDLFKMATDAIVKLQLSVQEKEKSNGNVRYPPKLISLEATIRANLSSSLAMAGVLHESATEYRKGKALDRMRPNEDCREFLREIKPMLHELFDTWLDSMESNIDVLSIDDGITNNHEMDVEEEESGDEEITTASALDESIQELQECGICPELAMELCREEEALDTAFASSIERAQDDCSLTFPLPDDESDDPTETLGAATTKGNADTSSNENRDVATVTASLPGDELDDHTKAIGEATTNVKAGMNRNQNQSVDTVAAVAPAGVTPTEEEESSAVSNSIVDPSTAVTSAMRKLHGLSELPKSVAKDNSDDDDSDDEDSDDEDIKLRKLRTSKQFINSFTEDPPLNAIDAKEHVVFGNRNAFEEGYALDFATRLVRKSKDEYFSVKGHERKLVIKGIIDKLEKKKLVGVRRLQDSDGTREYKKLSLQGLFANINRLFDNKQTINKQNAAKKKKQASRMKPKKKANDIKHRVVRRSTRSSKSDEAAAVHVTTGRSLRNRRTTSEEPPKYVFSLFNHDGESVGITVCKTDSASDILQTEGVEEHLGQKLFDDLHEGKYKLVLASVDAADIDMEPKYRQLGQLSGVELEDAAEIFVRPCVCEDSDEEESEVEGRDEEEEEESWRSGDRPNPLRASASAVVPTSSRSRCERRGHKRIQAEAWLDKYPFFRRNGFLIGFGRTHALYEVYCKYMYDNTSFGTEFTSYKCPDYRKKLGGVTERARHPSGIVIPKYCHKTGKKRAHGAPHASQYSEKIKNPNYHSDDRIETRREQGRQYRKSEKGLLTRKRESNRGKERRKEMCGAFVLRNGECNQDYCAGLMNAELDDLGGRSVVGYATHVGGVYVWYSGRDTEQGIRIESTRFLTDGQQKTSKNSRHNAVLMWNPHRHEFENNTCPHNERLDRGLRPLTKNDCNNLGIKSLLLLDDDLTKREACKIEQMCQYEINHLPLGKRLHRTPGAGASLEHDEEADVVARRVIGITFLPPDFFQRYPKICVVASAL